MRGVLLTVFFLSALFACSVLAMVHVGALLLPPPESSREAIRQEMYREHERVVGEWRARAEAGGRRFDWNAAWDEGMGKEIGDLCAGYAKRLGAEPARPGGK